MSSAFTKGVILFLAFIICVYSLGLVIFFVSRGAMVDQYYTALINQIKIYFTSLENEIERIGIAEDQLMLDEDLNALSHKRLDDFDYEMTRSIRKVISQMNMIKNSSDNIESVSVIIPSLKRIYRCGYGPSYSEYFYNPKEVQTQGIQQRIKFDSNDIKICAPLHTSRRGNTVSVEAKLSSQKMLQSIEKFNIIDEARSYLIFKQMDTVLTTESREEAQMVRTLLLKPDSISTVDIFGEKQLVINYHSDYLDVSYIQIVPEALITYSVDTFKPLYYAFNGFVLLAAAVYIVYTNRIVKKTVENEMYLQKLLYQKAELRQLQAQINPHFLYNSFFILKKRIAKGQNEEAGKFCDMLGMYFNYISQNYRDYTTLGDEVHHSRIYAEIQAIRFSDRITVSIEEVPQMYSGITVPRLILQPILENAFKYGLEDLEFDGTLNVSFLSDENYVYIHVEDNGVNIDHEKIRSLNGLSKDEEIKEISGLANIHKRMQLLSRDPATGLSFRKSELGGLCVILKIRKEALYD